MPLWSYASGTIDSLKNRLSTLTPGDTSYTRTLLQLSVEYNNISTDSQKAYAKLAITQPGIKDYPYLYCDATTQMGAALFAAGSHDSALNYYRKALKLCKGNDLTGKLSTCYANIGNVYLRITDYLTALTYYDSAIAEAEKNNNLLDMVKAKDNKAAIYHEQGHYKAALELFMEGKRLYEELGDYTSLESNLLNISNTYFRLGDYNNAIRYTRQAMDMSRGSGSKWTEISCYTNYAMIYDAEKKNDSSLFYTQKALQLSEHINNPYLTSVLMGNLAEAYMKTGKLDTAYILYNKTLALSHQLNDIEGVAIAKDGLGEIAIRRNHINRGIGLLKESLGILEKSGMKEEAMSVSGKLSKAYEKTGNYKQALDYERLKDKFQDSLEKEEAIKTARNLEFEYKLDKKQAEIELLEKNKDIEVAKLRQQQILLIAALIGFALAIIIAILVFRNLRQVKHSNQLILKQKEEIERQAKKLELLNNFKDTTFSVLSHDLRSPINALTGTMSMLDEGIITPEEFAGYKDELNNKLQSVTLMLDNLLQWAKSQMQGEHTLDIEKISIRRKTLKAFAVLKDAAEIKNIQLVAEVPDNLYAYADRNQMEMVMRNLVSNAIKFTPAGGSVTVNATQNGDKVAITITDTGVGMTAEQVNKLFDGTPNESHVGTSGEKGTGIGLQLSYNFVVSNGGNIVVQSKPDEGTTFLVTIPANNPA